MDGPPLFSLSLDQGLIIVRDAGLMLAAVIVVVRLTGLRAFAKMSAFDFTVTVAVGSTLAAIVVDPGKEPMRGLLAIAALMLAQVVVALVRVWVPLLGSRIDNTPLLLMDGPEILEDNLKASRLTRGDLIAKLREANVLDLSEVRAVVLETTGDVSVLHGEAGGQPLDPLLIAGVRR